MKVIVLSGDRRLTQLMQACGMWESWKAHCTWATVTITVLTAPDYEKILEVLRTGLESDGYIVAAIVIPEHVVYVNPAVKVVSDGEQWEVLRDVVARCSHATTE